MIADRNYIRSSFSQKRVHGSNPGSFELDPCAVLPISSQKKTVPNSLLSNFPSYKQAEGRPVPLKAGGCTGHHGRTLHYTRGNNSTETRRAFIVNFRPAEMVKLEREMGVDHGLTVSDSLNPLGDKFKCRFISL